MRMSHFNKIDVQKWLQDRRFSNYRVSPEKKIKMVITGQKCPPNGPQKWPRWNSRFMIIFRNIFSILMVKI